VTRFERLVLVALDILIRQREVGDLDYVNVPGRPTSNQWFEEKDKLDHDIDNWRNKLYQELNKPVKD
jgi:hypothetical protein